MPHMGLRQLQQEAEVSIATAVYSAEQLLDAVLSGAEHIVVQEHLDLTNTQPLSAVSLLNQNREGITDFGRSIQVRLLCDFKLSCIASACVCGLSTHATKSLKRTTV